MQGAVLCILFKIRKLIYGIFAQAKELRQGLTEKGAFIRTYTRNREEEGLEAAGT